MSQSENEMGKNARQSIGHATNNEVIVPVAESLNGESGQTTVITAFIMATFLFGFIAMGIDVSSMFTARRQAQAAADAAAVAAAEEAGNGTAAETSAAAALAKMNGFDTGAATNPATITLGVPTSGSFNGSSSYIQVTVSKPVQTLFAPIFTHRSVMTVSARAVAAAGQTSPSCICLEGKTGTDLNMSNGTSLNMTGCGAMIDSSSSNAITLTGSSTITSPSLGMVSSTWTSSANVNNGASISAGTKIVTGIHTACAPPLPTLPSYNASQCTADPLTYYNNGGSSYSVGPGGDHTTTQAGGLVCYNGLTVGRNSDTVNVNSGIYVINGGTLEFENGHANASNTGGNSVLFYLTNGANLIIDQGANVNLTAATSGTYAGVLIIQDPGDSTVGRAADTQPMSLAGGSNTSFNGSILAPTSNVTLSNGSNTTISADMVANTLTMTGSGSLLGTDIILNGSPSVNFGTLNTSTAKLTE